MSPFLCVVSVCVRDRTRAFRQGGGRQAVQDRGRGVPAACRVQRAPGGRAGGPQAAGAHAHRLHQLSEGGPDREGKEAGGELPHLAPDPPPPWSRSEPASTVNHPTGGFPTVIWFQVILFREDIPAPSSVWEVLSCQFFALTVCELST